MVQYQYFPQLRKLIAIKVYQDSASWVMASGVLGHIAFLGGSKVCNVIDLRQMRVLGSITGSSFGSVKSLKCFETETFQKRLGFVGTRPKNSPNLFDIFDMDLLLINCKSQFH
jgi:hypothetical protein